MRHIIPISGKDSLATALIQTTHFSNYDYEYFFNDTGAELPETYEWLDKVEAKTGWQIIRVGKNLEDHIAHYGGVLPSIKMRFCTSSTKIKPMEKYLGKDDEISIYYGLRADENRTGYVPIAGSKITPHYPLQDFGIDLRGVWAILQAQNLLPPSFFWQRLYDAVEKRIDVTGITLVEKHFLFAGRSRANCYFCFFQRQAEILWLMETHPDYFERMSAMEKSDYTWLKDFSIAEFKADKLRQQRAFNRKVNEVVAYIAAKQQMQIPGLEVDTEIAQTSCGLMCGK
jgi:hypothetical protein